MGLEGRVHGVRRGEAGQMGWGRSFLSSISAQVITTYINATRHQSANN